MNLNRVFIDYPGIRPYFYDNKELERGNADRERVLAMAEMMLDVFEWVLHDRYTFSDYDRETWGEYIRHILASSEVLRAYQRRHPEWHPFVARVDEAGRPDGAG